MKSFFHPKLKVFLPFKDIPTFLSNLPSISFTMDFDGSVNPKNITYNTSFLCVQRGNNLQIDLVDAWQIFITAFQFNTQEKNIENLVYIITDSENV